MVQTLLPVFSEHYLPEWLQQRIAILSGQAKWDDFTFAERTCKGWLLPLLWEIDSMFSGRWWYWTKTLESGKALEEPIPQIDFLDFPNTAAMNNLTKCLSAYNRYDFRLSDFLEWLLWGFGVQDERTRISDDANEYLYRTFNLGLLLKYPHDYLGQILTEEKAGYWNNPNAFYPTPHVVCSAMVQMQFADTIRKGEDLKSKSVLDPCIGTGRMLMYASNYSLFLYGQDIDRTCCMACTVNGYLYMPWLVKALPELGPENEPCEVVPALEVSPPGKVINLGKPIQMQLFD
jgi:N-6 DNA Methylase